MIETTLACNARCLHCGSAAGEPRPRELSTDETLALVDDLAALGCRSLTLSGGEPLLRPDWQQVAFRARERGLRVELISNGLEVARQAEAIAKVGFFAVSLSVDGLGPTHDTLRGVEGCFDQLLVGARALRSRGVRLGAVTQVNQLNLHELDGLEGVLTANRFDGWQLQLTTPRGRALSRRSSLCLHPADLRTLEGLVLTFRARGRLFVKVSDSVGYMSVSDPRLRGGRRGRRQIFPGCQAGLSVIGITSDGGVRGCLSLPSEFEEASIRTRPLTEIWNDPMSFAYNRSPRSPGKGGTCDGCGFFGWCRGGCSSLSFTTSGRLGDNAYCLHALSVQGGA